MAEITGNMVVEAMRSAAIKMAEREGAPDTAIAEIHDKEVPPEILLMSQDIAEELNKRLGS